MKLTTLKSAIEKTVPREGLPKGAFCRKDLEKQGITRNQACTLLANACESGAVFCIGKFPVAKASGDMGMVPFYKEV